MKKQKLRKSIKNPFRGNWETNIIGGPKYKIEFQCVANIADYIRTLQQCVDELKEFAHLNGSNMPIQVDTEAQ